MNRPIPGVACPIVHAMSPMGHVGIEHCTLAADHDGDCLVEWMGQKYWCSQQGWDGHPPKPIKEMAEKHAI